MWHFKIKNSVVYHYGKRVSFGLCPVLHQGITFKESIVAIAQKKQFSHNRLVVYTFSKPLNIYTF